MVPLRQLAPALVALALVGCGSSSEKLPDEAVASPEARVKEIEGSTMPPQAKAMAEARFKAEAEAARQKTQAGGK